MKFFVPIVRSTFMLTVFALLSFTGKAQLNGGTIAIPSACASASSPAPNISNVTSASGGSGAYSYQWEAKIAASQWTTVIGATSENLSPGILFYSTDYRRKVTDASGATAYSNIVSFLFGSNLTGGSIYLSGYGTVLINTLPPEIASVAPANYGSGSYSYTWEISVGSSTGPWNTIAGITSSNYQPPAFTTEGIYYIRRKATDNNCGNSAYSNSVVITVVLTQAFDPRSWTSVYGCVFPGSLPGQLTGQLPIGGTPPYTYQWEQKTASTSWTVVAGATGISYTPTSFTENTSYRRKASDASGNSGYSGEAEIILATGTPNAGLIATNPATLIAPNAPTYTVVNVQSASYIYGGNYKWDLSTDNGGSWQPSSFSAGSSNYYAESTPTTRTCYRRSIDNICASAQYTYYTNIVCIDPPNPLTSGTISSSYTGTCVTAGTSPGTLNGTPATGGSTPYSYQWQKNDNGNWENIAGETGVNYTSGALNHNTSFRRQVTDANNTILYSNEIAINLQAIASLKGGIVDGPIVTCSGTAPGIINNILDACGGGGSLQYTWETSSNGGSWTNVTNTNAPTYNATSISVDTKYRRKVGDGCGNAAYSNEVPVYVYPAIEAGTITPVSQTVCSNTQVPEVLSLMQNCHYTNGTVSYQWQKASSATGPWTDINSTQSFYQAGLASAITYYRLKVSSTVCGAVAYSNIATIDVKLCTVTSNSGSRTSNGMQLYPNPVAQGQTVIVTLNGAGNNNAATFKATLRSVDGRTYGCTVTGTSNSTNSSTQLQVKLPIAMAKGTYFIQVSNSQKQWADRIIVY